MEGRGGTVKRPEGNRELPRLRGRGNGIHQTFTPLENAPRLAAGMRAQGEMPRANSLTGFTNFFHASKYGTIAPAHPAKPLIY